ncbi:MAG TPA: type I restriction endonuclease [Anaeromyxobacteraceae bacterium]|jgi:type I restriction enzyme R subunit|nr:type I restriction endonuclease [Anaeromyxobacteraceae bacterium]
MPQHIERAFEDAIEEHLLGHGWHKGSPDHFDRTLALDAGLVIDFIAETQPKVWGELTSQHGASVEKTIIEWLVKALDHQGTLDVLRHGFKFMGKLLRVASFKPSHGLNPDLVMHYGKNRLTVTRQVKFDPASEKSLDMVLSLNGLPIATVELKNPLTGQNVNHAIEQYKSDRDPRLPLFQFKKRALVHFAVDPDVVYMATELRGKDTFFLPFNSGSGTGAGNPEVNAGYKTSYLWEEVWARDSFLDILARFMHVATEEKQVAGKKVTTETVIFPRYHQLDSVRKLEAAARVEGPGNSYLIQHSAGSGKSNSIAWLAYRLAELHKDDARVFQSVVVVTDRRVLDAQLQKTIYQFDHTDGVVQKIDDNSTQLAEALTKGTPIIITTLQKFPFVAAKIAELPNRAYAVIVDEAHSSQGGESAAKLKEVLRARAAETATPQEAQLAVAEAETANEGGTQEDDADDVLQKVMESRGRQKNLSFFAFTATPKAKTLEVFGRKGEDGKPQPFHLYSMRQAIEEEFILDVLQNYTTYKNYWKLLKASADDPKVPKRETAAQLARFVSLHPHNIAQKTEVMIEHFRSRVKQKIGGKAKAMVVTGSRLHAVRYRQAFDRYIAEKGYTDVGVLVAFSGEVEDPDIEGSRFTEPGMNGGISEKQLPAEFASGAYNVLLVANKYQTGFDQPLLHTMYVDKRLSGVQAVQTLSRLNRTCRGKEDTFVLDFVNDEEEIRRSFQPYYEQTTVSETADPQNLYKLQHQLEGHQTYTASEVESFCRVFYRPRKTQTTADHAEMYRYLAPAVDRFKALEPEAQDEFRVALGAYVRLYAFLSQILPFTDPDLEKLYTFGRFLEARLPPDPKKAPLKLDAETVLAYYRLDLVRDGTIAMKAGEEAPIYGPTEAGTKRSESEDVKLSEIIEILNDRFGTDFTRADQLFFDSVIAEATADEQVQQWAGANPLDGFSLAMKAKLRDAVVDRLDKNEKIATRYLNERDFEDAAFRELVRRIYEDLRPAG